MIIIEFVLAMLNELSGLLLWFLVSALGLSLFARTFITINILNSRKRKSKDRKWWQHTLPSRLNYSMGVVLGSLPFIMMSDHRLVFSLSIFFLIVGIVSMMHGCWLFIQMEKN